MWLSLGGLCAAVLSLAGIFLYLDPQVPAAETYRNVQLETPLRVYSSEGALLGEFGERRLIPVDLEDVPQQFINALLDTEDVTVDFDASGVQRIAEVAFQVNESTENIGARRLHTVMERLLETVSFEASDRGGASLTIDDAYVDEHLADLSRDEDLSRYIL